MSFFDEKQSLMSLNLDPRQRAMLREMGIRVWQPVAPVAEAPSAIEFISAHVDAASATSRFAVNYQPAEALATPVSSPPPYRPAAPPALTAKPPVVPHPTPGDDAPAYWLLGEAQTLYADTAQPGGARWLVLAETPAAALRVPVFAGDAGKLLADMLRAARLERAGAVLFAPLVRQAAATAQELPAALPELIANARPDVVLIMGRLAALALVPSGEHFGKLRGKVHTLHGAKTVVTYDAAYLLRKSEHKAGAWNDLCLAMSLASPVA